MVLYTQIKGKPDQKNIDKQPIKTTNKMRPTKTANINNQQKQPTKEQIPLRIIRRIVQKTSTG